MSTADDALALAVQATRSADYGSLKRIRERSFVAGSAWHSSDEEETPAKSWTSVCYSPELNLLVAVSNTGTGNRAMVSSDGLSWGLVDTPEDNNWQKVCWSPDLGLFCAVAASGGSRVMTSPDGIEWTARSAPSNTWRSVIWVGGEFQRFVAVGNSGTGNRVMTSPDGVTWTSQASAGDYEWYDVCYSPQLKRLVATAYSCAVVMVSDDGGEAWSTSYCGSGDWIGCCWAPELGLYATCSLSGSSIATSPDGLTWTAHKASDHGWYRIAWSPRYCMFAAVANNGNPSGSDYDNRVITSFDGETWTQRTSANFVGFLDICWHSGQQRFIAVGENGTGTNVIRSPAASDMPYRP